MTLKTTNFMGFPNKLGIMGRDEDLQTGAVSAL
jgi:hypothetical protein